MGDTEGERLARLEVKVDQLVSDMRTHISDHKQASADAAEAKETAKQAAMLTAINHRNNRATMAAAWIGGGIVIVSQIANVALRLMGH